MGRISLNEILVLVFCNSPLKVDFVDRYSTLNYQVGYLILWGRRQMSLEMEWAFRNIFSLTRIFYTAPNTWKQWKCFPLINITQVFPVILSQKTKKVFPVVVWCTSWLNALHTLTCTHSWFLSKRNVPRKSEEN